jgi:hypothetical protein
MKQQNNTTDERRFNADARRYFYPRQSALLSAFISGSVNPLKILSALIRVKIRVNPWWRSSAAMKVGI